jgi:hypothetical protein
MRDMSEIRRAILRQWMRDQERAPAWIARKVGYTREYVALVLGGRYPFTDKLARACTAALGIDFGYAQPSAEDGHEDCEALLTGAARRG